MMLRNSSVALARRHASWSKNVRILAVRPDAFYLSLPSDREDKKDASLRASLQQVRALHTSPKSQSFILACVGVAGAAFGASIVLDSVAKRSAEQAAAAAAAGSEGKTDKDQEAAAGSGLFSSLFNNVLGAKTFYQGGFEEKMTKREAALILGVRESASREKIREAHRYMSRANHPDTGGSEYLAMKINEAKDMLLGSK
jgi:DnaJ family protein C protein 19